MDTMNTNKVRTAPIALLLAGSLLCCAGCGNAPQDDSPDLAWEPQAPALQTTSNEGATTNDPGPDAAAVDALIDEVASPTGTASSADDPAALMDEHKEAYDELLAGGDATLRQVTRMFLNDEQAGARGEVMFSLLLDLLGEEAPLVEAEVGDPVSLSQGDAQSRFNALFVAAGILLDRHGLDYMLQNMPHTYVMLTAVQD